jgi:hypothetical protein
MFSFPIELIGNFSKRFYVTNAANQRSLLGRAEQMLYMQSDFAALSSLRQASSLVLAANEFFRPVDVGYI